VLWRHAGWRRDGRHRPLAHQGLLDDFDIRVLNFNFDILEDRHHEPGVGVIIGVCAGRATTITDPTLAWKDPPLQTISAPIITAPIPAKDPAQILYGRRDLGQLKSARSANVTKRDRSTVQLDQA
jgi:hypothetical protein